MAKQIRSHRDLDVYNKAMDLAMWVFEESKQLPREEMYSLTDQFRKSSRSVCANIAEAWRKRRYEASFISKLSDAETEASETQVWLEFAVKCGYMQRKFAAPAYKQYDEGLATLVGMITHADKWVFPMTPKARQNGRANS